MNPWLKVALFAAGGGIGIAVLIWRLLLWVLDGESAEYEARIAELRRGER